MKKLFLLSLAVCMMACSNKDDFESEAIASNSMQESEVSVVSVVDGTIFKASTRGDSDTENLALAFSTQWAYENFKEKLNGMTKAQKIDYVKSLGVESLKDLEVIADEELEEIDSAATSDEEFWLMYEQYKEKYAGILYPDFDDEHNLTLYAPEGDDTEAFIANKDWVYVIGNKVVKAKLQPASKTVSLKSTTGNQINEGSWQIPIIPEKTFCFKAYTNERHEFKIRFYTRKTMWHGGSKDDPHRDYYVKFNVNNAAFSYSGNYVPLLLQGNVQGPIYDFYQPRHGVDHLMGYFRNYMDPITGYVRLWTDLTVEHNPDGSVATELYPEHGCQIPRCLDVRAHYININLTSE